MQKAVICDIDGCLLDSSIPIMMKDLAIAQGEDPKVAWSKFYDNLTDCIKQEWCYTILEGLIAQDIPIIYITGREERARKNTVPFLSLSKPYKWELHMRPLNDTREDFVIKNEILTTLTEKYDFMFAIDDRADNCAVYKSFGIVPLHVMIGKHNK